MSSILPGADAPKTGGDGEYGRLVSCGVICEGRVAGLFEWDGKLYAVTGALWPGLKSGEPPQAFCEQVKPLAEYKGKTYDYDEKCRLKGDGCLDYKGIVVNWKGRAYVFCGSKTKLTLVEEKGRRR